MFGVGAQEVAIIVVLLLVIFGPAKLGHLAKEVGRFAYKARASMEEFKEEFSVAQYPEQDHENPWRSHSENRPETADEQSPTKTTQIQLTGDEGSNDDSLLRPPIKHTIATESPEGVPLGTRE